jgi:hypothetical protein
MRLSNYWEIIGTLSDVKLVNGNYNLKFSVVKNVEVPAVQFSETELKKLVKKRIGIINADGQYRYRIITKNQSHNRDNKADAQDSESASSYASANP